MNYNYDEYDTFGSAQQGESQAFELLDIVTIYSLMLQIEDHRMARHNDSEINEIRDTLREVNAKLDKIMEMIANGNRNN